MTLFISWLIIGGLQLPSILYVVAIIIWLFHVAFWEEEISKSRKKSKDTYYE